MQGIEILRLLLVIGGVIMDRFVNAKATFLPNAREIMASARLQPVGLCPPVFRLNHSPPRSQNTLRPASAKREVDTRHGVDPARQYFLNTQLL